MKMGLEKMKIWKRKNVWKNKIYTTHELLNPTEFLYKYSLNTNKHTHTQAYIWK